MKTYLAVLLACLALSARADGPSTFESAGVLDAYVKVCTELAPAKAEFYKQRILAGMSCGKPVAEVDKSLAEIRDSKHPQVRAAYQTAYQKALEPFLSATAKQKQEFCTSISEVKC
jgi:hypothetical protein